MCELKCMCACENKLSVILGDSDAILEIYEGSSEHTGHRKSIIVPRELGVIICEYIAAANEED